MHTVLCKSIQYTEYRVNTENCFLWYVRAVLESIFSTQYSKANSVQILQRTVSLGDSTERSVVPAAGCCFLPEGLTPKLHRKLALHIVCCVDPCKHSEALISKPVHAPVQTKPNHSPLYIPDLPLGVWNHWRSQQTAPSANTAGPIMLSRALRTCIVVCMHLYSRLYIVKWICTKKLSFIAGTAFRL